MFFAHSKILKWNEDINMLQEQLVKPVPLHCTHESLLLKGKRIRHNNMLQERAEGNVLFLSQENWGFVRIVIAENRLGLSVKRFV